MGLIIFFHERHERHEIFVFFVFFVDKNKQPHLQHSALELLLHSFLHINFQRSERLFVPLDGRLQGEQHSLCRVKVGNDSVINRNRCRWKTYRLRIKSEVDDQFFGRARYATKVRIGCADFGVIKLDRRRRRSVFRDLCFGHNEIIGVKICEQDINQ